MLGGYDMNQFGVASQGKLIEKKNVAEAFTFRSRITIHRAGFDGESAKLYKAMLEVWNIEAQPSSNLIRLPTRTRCFR